MTDITNKEIEEAILNVFKNSKVHIQNVDDFLFIEVINPSFNKIDKSGYIKNIIDALYGNFSDQINVYNLSIYDNEEKAFTERGHLHIERSRREQSGMYTTILNAGDAYLLLKEIDVLYLDYCVSILLDKDFEISGKEISSGTFSQFPAKEDKYAELEIKGDHHFDISLKKDQTYEGRWKIKGKIGYRPDPSLG